MLRLWLIAFTGFFVCAVADAHADYQQRIELGAGIVSTNNPAQTNLEISAEYEYRIEPKLGYGLSANYIFSNPGILLLAVPEAFLHPLEGDWLISGAPLLEFGPGSSTNIGLKIGTRVPIPLRSVTLIPEVAVDFIANGPITVFGLGIQF